MVGGFSVSRTASLDCIKYKIQVLTTICSPPRVSLLAALPTSSVTDTLAWLCDDHPSHRLGCARDLLSELFGFSLAVSLGLGPFDRQARKREETFPEAALALLLSLSPALALRLMSDAVMPSTCPATDAPLLLLSSFPLPLSLARPRGKNVDFHWTLSAAYHHHLPRNTLLRCVASSKQLPAGIFRTPFHRNASLLEQSTPGA